MPIDQEGKLRKIAGRRQLVSLGIFGLLLLVFSNLQNIKNFLHDWSIPLPEVGIAAVIAAILGWVVDERLKEGLIRDAVAAAIGYLLPDRLKSELNWVYDQRFLVTQTYAVRLEHLADEKIVLLHGHVTRLIRNVSGEKAKFEISGGTDEWFSPYAESQITKCGFVKNGTTTLIEYEKNVCGISYRHPDVLILDSEESIQLFFSYRLTMHENGIELLTYGYPIVDPLVTMDVPDTLLGCVTFSHRKKYDVVNEPENGFISKPLDGVLLPHQDIRIQWYLASEIEARKLKIRPPA